MYYVINLRKSKKAIQEKIIEFFMGKNSVPDKEVHAFAESLGIKHDVLEGMVYDILVQILNFPDKSASQVDPKQLAMGIKVEQEHTTFPSIARQIALSHLGEIPDYYTRLKVMEDEAKKNGKNKRSN